MKSSTAAKNREASKESGKMHQEVEKIKKYKKCCGFYVSARFKGVIQCWWQGEGVFLAAALDDRMIDDDDPRASFQIEEKWKESKGKRKESQKVLCQSNNVKEILWTDSFVDFRWELESVNNLKIRLILLWVTKLVYLSTSSQHILRNDCITGMNSRHLFRTRTPMETQIPNTKVRIFAFH